MGLRGDRDGSDAGREWIVSDTQNAFQDLQAITGRGFDATALHADLDEVERRIGRYRTGRAVLSSVVALAVVGGAWLAAMSGPFGGDGGRGVPPVAGPTTRPDVSSAADQTPSDVSPTRAPAISVFGEPYPAGVDAPNLVYLVTGDKSAKVLSETDTEFIFSLYRATSQGDAWVPVPFPKGNVLVLAADDWECSWIAEFVSAVGANDTERVAAAAAELKKYPDLDVIQNYNPKLGEADRVSLIPRIIGGDVAFAQRWLNADCGRIRN